MTYSCSKSSGPRGRKYKTTHQDGWREVWTGKEWISVRNMVEYEADWKPMKCGIQPQAGLPPDPLCKGCPNAQL